ncbi:MAG: hypothetical protein VB083_04205 [Aminobacterium sp.]|nr:hypothetical protein [Aminobacterium sp.]MEA4877086.1 hypothetical protein [Aminobacterium sp.]
MQQMSVIMSFCVITVFMAIGDVVSNKTKAFVPSVFVAATLFLFGFWTFVPSNVDIIAGLGMPVALMAMYLLLVHMGTLMSLKELVSEWKTITIALCGIGGMVGVLLTLGRLFVAKEAIIVGTPPLTGGIVAAIMMNQAATEKGLTTLAILAIVMYVMQGFVGYPLTALALKKEGKRLLSIYHNGGEELEKLQVNSKSNKQTAETRGRFQFIPPLPDSYQTTFMLLAKTGLVAWAAVGASALINDFISKFVLCLIFGVIAAEIGFLERKPLNKSGSFGYLMLSLMAYVFVALAKATPAMLTQMAGDLVIIIIIGVIGMGIASMIVGKLLGYSKAMAFALTLTALYGFPPNYILTEEAARALADNPEEFNFLMDHMLPKMLVGGFTTVTVASVIIAGIFVKML